MTQATATPLYVFVGTYTRTMPHVRGKAEGIYIFRLDRATGALTPAGEMLGLSNPSYLAFDPTERYLYAVDETDQGKVGAFAVDPATAALTRLEQHVSSEGDVPCYLSVDPSGRWVLVANYTSGHIATLPIQADGSLGDAVQVVRHQGHSVHPRQASAHAHWISVDPAGRYVLATDLGLDQVLVYHFDPEYGTLTPNDPPACDLPPGSGPRHIAFHPSGRFAYVINEIASTVTACAYDGVEGVLRPLQTLSTLPADFQGESTTAAIRVHPSGRFVYGSNRGHDSLALFRVDEADGTLTPLGHTPTQGRNPRDFNLDPTGTFLIAANQDSDTLVTFRVDAATGRLTPTGDVTPALTPVCIVFYPKG